MAGSRPDSEVDRETRDELWQTIGRILERYQPQECRNFFNNASYAICTVPSFVRASNSRSRSRRQFIISRMRAVALGYRAPRALFLRLPGSIKDVSIVLLSRVDGPLIKSFRQHRIWKFW